MTKGTAEYRGENDAKILINESVVAISCRQRWENQLWCSSMMPRKGDNVEYVLKDRELYTHVINTHTCTHIYVYMCIY